MAFKPINLQEQLNAYHKAFEEEYKVTQADGEERAEQVAAKFFKDHLDNALTTIVTLCVSAESESTRLNAARYIVEFATSEPNRKKADELELLISKLTKPVMAATSS